MAQSLLFYDGTTYGLSADVAKDLLDRGLIVVDPASDIYALSLEHEIAEVEPFATVVERSDAPRPPRLGRLQVRGFSLFGGVEQKGLPPTTNRQTRTSPATADRLRSGDIGARSPTMQWSDQARIARTAAPG